jgi:UDP:flavonoid glycosyltransferase YjiC (YdhE family)
MRILLAATPMSGHVNPVLAAARILVDHGHDVVVTTGTPFRASAEATGARFAPLLAGADLDLTNMDATFPARRHLAPGLPQLAFDFRHLFIDTIPAQFAGLETVLQTFPAELIMADTLFGGTLPFLLGARARRPAIAGLGVTCLLTRRTDGAPVGMGLPPAGDAATVASYAAIAAQAEEHLLAPSRQRVDAILGSLGARALPMPYLEALVGLHDVFLQPSVPGFDFPCMILPANLHFIGALPRPAAAPLPPALAAAVADGRRIVLVTQGTVANHDLGQLIAPTVTALAGRADVLILVATGGRPVAAIPVPLPANALAAEFLPFDALMPHIDLLVTNGGYGAVTQALTHGVPVIAAGTTEDKQDVNARIAWCRAGLDLRTDTPTVDQVRSAIASVLDDDSYRDRARALAGEFASYQPARSLCALLEQAVARHAQQLPSSCTANG